MDNSHRLDIRLGVELDREDQIDYLPPVLPYDENSYTRWNSNPFQLKGGSGYSEDEPSAWLFPYWMARFLGHLE